MNSGGSATHSLAFPACFGNHLTTRSAGRRAIGTKDQCDKSDVTVTVRDEVPSRMVCLPVVTCLGASLNYAPSPNSSLSGPVRMAHRIHTLAPVSSSRPPV